MGKDLTVKQLIGKQLKGKQLIRKQKTGYMNASSFKTG